MDEAVLKVTRSSDIMCDCVTVNLCSLAVNDQLSCPALDSSVSRSAGEFEVNHPVASRARAERENERACIESCACLSETGLFCLLYSASLCELGLVFLWVLRFESSCLTFINSSIYLHCSVALGNRDHAQMNNIYTFKFAGVHHKQLW